VDAFRCALLHFSGEYFLRKHNAIVSLQFLSGHLFSVEVDVLIYGFMTLSRYLRVVPVLYGVPPSTRTILRNEIMYFRHRK
jgi:hypothetical protein